MSLTTAVSDCQRLDALLLDYAAAVAANNHRGELRQRSERLFTEAFHRALRNDGCAEEILSSLRPTFDKAAEAIAAARDVIPADAPAEQFLRTAQPAAISCWQQLDGHLGTASSIGRIATSFGPRGDFAVFDEYALSEGFKVSDTAIFCTSGPLEYDSAIFLRGTGIHRASPWFKVSLKLNAVAEARSRYHEWCANEWDLLNSGSPGSVVGEDGKMRELPRPKTRLRQRHPRHDREMKPRWDNVRQPARRPARRKDRRPAPAGQENSSRHPRTTPVPRTERSSLPHHGISKLTSLHKKVGASRKLPKRLVEDVGATRNKATHSDYSPTIDETNLAIDTAVLVVEQAYPLTSF